MRFRERQGSTSGGVKEAVPAVGIRCQGDTQTGFFVHADHASVVREGHGRVPLHVLVVLLGDPVAAGQVRRLGHLDDRVAQLGATCWVRQAGGTYGVGAHLGGP